MRASVLAAAGVALMVSLPANADHRHYRAHYGPSVSFSYAYGYPFGYRAYGFPYYPRRFGYFYPSSFDGIGVHLGSRYPVRRARAERDRAEPAGLKLYVYPAAGQSEEQLADDRYECHVWGADQTGFDPTLGAGSRREAEQYGRAFTACMEGRDYVVK
jgi:hypothetical protein